MIQNIEEYWWVYIIIYVILGTFWIMRCEKENDILGKKFHRKEEYFKCSYLDCGWDERVPKKYTYFINGNPIACITEIKYTLRKHYFTTLNYNYDTSDFKDIVKEAIKEKKRQDNIRFKEQLNNDNSKVKLYELVNQEDSANGNR